MFFKLLILRFSRESIVQTICMIHAKPKTHSPIERYEKGDF